MTKKIVVAISDDSGRDAALDWALARVHDSSTQLELTTVVDLDWDTDGEFEDSAYAAHDVLHDPPCPVAVVPHPDAALVTAIHQLESHHEAGVADHAH